jgi:transcriptional regulator of acetoin/glycerol metabolism
MTLINRWASWGGLKVPPNKPIRIPAACGGKVGTGRGLFKRFMLQSKDRSSIRFVAVKGKTGASE